MAKSVYSIGSNLTISTLTFAPKPKDNGRVLACQAKITDLPGSGMDDKKKIAVYCKYIFDLSLKTLFLHYITARGALQVNC